MSNCSTPQLPWGWICQQDPLPSQPVSVIFLIFDFLVLGSILAFYYYSGITSYRNTKISYFNWNQMNETEIVHFWIKVAFLWVGLGSLNNILTHLMSVITDRQAYFFIGYNSVFSIIGVTLMVVASFVYMRFYFHNRQIPKAHKFIINTIISLLVIMNIALVTFYRQIGLDQATSFAIIIYIIVFIIILLLIFYLYFIFEYTNRMLAIRMKLIVAVYVLFGLYLVWMMLFLPTDVQIPTQTNAIEINLFGQNIFFLSVAFILYMVYATPKWLRNYLGIDDEEFREYTYKLYGIDPPNTIHLDLEPYVISPMPKASIDSLDKGFLLFHNISDGNLAKVMFTEFLRSRSKIFETFETNKTKELFFSQQLNSKSNLFFIANEIDEGLDNVIDQIYHHYNWDINYYNGTIELNGYPFPTETNEFALIFSGPSFWNFNRRIYFLLFNPEISSQVYHFFDNYFEFLEEETFVNSPYLIMLFFDKDENGIVSNIPPDNNDPGQPDENHYKIF